MHTLKERIDFDVNELHRYFEVLFSVAQNIEAHDPYSPDPGYCPNFKAFIRPDMTCNVYSLVLFWLPQLRMFHEHKGGLPKGKSELEQFHTCFTRDLYLNLDSVLSSYEHLGWLRLVRNVLVHSGSHIDDKGKKKCLEM
jgi:hypothetical protein